MLDFSWALIQASLDEFCREETNDYLNRTRREITGKATTDDLNKSLLHICAFHVMQMCRRNAKRLYNKEQNEKSQVHFASRLMGRLINCQSIEEVDRLVEKVIIVLRTKRATQEMREALLWLQNSINTFSDNVDDNSSNCTNIDNQNEFYSEGNFLDNESTSEPNKTDGKSLMHMHWQSFLGNIRIDAKSEEDSNLELNRYYMPLKVKQR